jgi:hypothetical protein
MRHADHLTSPADSALPGRAGQLNLESSQFPGDTLRLVTLSWSVFRRNGGLLDPKDFLTTLDQLRGRRPEPWDVLLASGRTLSSEPLPQEIRARVRFPVLFEVINGRGNTPWFKNARFRVTPGLSARTPIVPRLERVYATMWLAWGAAALISRKPGVPQTFQPVSVRLTRQQLRGTLADPTRVFTA